MRRASTAPWWCPSTRPAPTRRPRTSCSRSSCGPWAPVWSWWGRTSTSVTAAPATWRCSPRWARGTDSTWSGLALEEDASHAGGVVHAHPRAAGAGRRGRRGGAARASAPGAGDGGPRRRTGWRRARVPDGQRRGPRGRGHARRGDLRLLVRAARRVGPRRRRVAGAAPDLPRRGRGARARGVPPGLQRRPLRRAGPGLVREPTSATSAASTPPRRSCAR